MTEVVTAVLSTLVEYNNGTYYDNSTGTDDIPSQNENSQGGVNTRIFGIITPIAMILIALIGLTGNIVVLHIIFRNKEMQNITNYFIANLAMTDIALLLTCDLPTAALSASIIPLGVVLCKVVNYMQHVSIKNKS